MVTVAIPAHFVTVSVPVTTYCCCAVTEAMGLAILLLFNPVAGDHTYWFPPVAVSCALENTQSISFDLNALTGIGGKRVIVVINVAESLQTLSFIFTVNV